MSGLPELLRNVAVEIEHGQLPLAVQDRLQRALTPVLTYAARDAALRRLAGLLGRYRASRWATAQLLARRLREFERVAWRNIRGGGREPYDETEALLATVMQAGGAGARTIWGALQTPLQKSRGSVCVGNPTDR